MRLVLQSHCYKRKLFLSFLASLAKGNAPVREAAAGSLSLGASRHGEHVLSNNHIFFPPAVPPVPPRAVSQIACTCQIPILCVLGLAKSTVLGRSPKWEQLAALGMPASSGGEEDEGVQHRPAIPLAPCRPVLAGWIFP